MVKEWLEGEVCKECGLTERPLLARGLCDRCYGRLRYREKHPECKPQERLGQSDEMVECACGCGELRKRYNIYGRECKYINHHWGKGRKLSQETLDKLAANRPGMSGKNNPMWGKLGTNLGKRFSEEHKRKISMANSGVRNPSWKGGTSNEQWRRFGNRGWKGVARVVRQRDGYVCQECGNKRSERRLCVHHIVPWHNSRDNSPSNLITLCYRCHGLFENDVAKNHIYLQVARSRSG